MYQVAQAFNMSPREIWLTWDYIEFLDAQEFVAVQIAVDRRRAKDLGDSD